MKAPKERTWKPVAGENFEAATCGSVSIKIYRRDRKKANGKGSRVVYEVADYSQGRRRLLSFKSHNKAWDKAGRLADMLAIGETTAAQMRGTDATAYGRAMEFLRPTGVPLEVAAAHFAQAWTILGADKIVAAAELYKLRNAENITRRTVLEVVNELVAAREARGKSWRYVSDLRARLRKFAKAFAVDISSVSTSDVQGWLDKLDVAPRTAKNFRGSLATLFKFAAARQYIAKGTDPITDTEQVSTNGGESIAIYTPEEVAQLIKAASKEFLPLVVLGAFGGLRSAEAERLEWSDIDFSSGFITVAAAKAKTRSRRLVPILLPLRAWLMSYSKKKGKIWTGSARDLLDARAAAVDASGVEWQPNGLRHSFCSYRLADIQDVAQVALEAGNSPGMIFQHYRELVQPPAAKAWFSVAPAMPANVVNLKSEQI